jgi:hypothetical protein
MASHIQNLPSTGDSLWVGTVAAVPFPGALLLFGSGLMGMLGVRKTRQVI